MLRPRTGQSQATAQTLVPPHKPPLSGGRTVGLPSLWMRRPRTCIWRKVSRLVRHVPSKTMTTKAATSTTSDESTFVVKAVVTVKVTSGGLLENLKLSHGLDQITYLLGKSILLELVSAYLDPITGLERETIKGYAHPTKQDEKEVKYECTFELAEDFGEIGAVMVENEHHKEMFLETIDFEGLESGAGVSCNSWIASKFDVPGKRVFFTTKSYLPVQTPSGLTRLREKELADVRGDGVGERKSNERIYDYDVYNDLGDPDSSADLKRPVLGGKEHPYPRRCRTGRPRSKTDSLSESRSSSIIYVPRDEAFSDVKELTFSAKTVYSVLHAVVPSLQTAIVDTDLGFPHFTAVDSLFNQGIDLPPLTSKSSLKHIVPRLIKSVTDAQKSVLRFETPATFEKDTFSWFRDDEYSRQTLAGINPYSIQLVKEWPLMSKLDPKIYGPPESAITKDLIEKEIKGFMTFEEAIEGKKLFMLDYHDLLLPYVDKVREVKGTTLYGSRTLFFLLPGGTLRPLAIELTRPPTNTKPQWKQVFAPCWDATGCWLWRLAKAHALAHDSGYHQLVSHWLRTHCATEPYIIATKRQLSAMHPIYRLLHPHFRYTMEINALAREALINAGGIIETSFSTVQYSMELSSVAYDQQWRFDLQALPADLISRGMAVEDEAVPHGLKLTIEDYPFANDGLILWDAIKKWVTDYVEHYYKSKSLIKSDTELQAWWTEIRTVGHGDKKDQPWWPELETTNDLTGILTNMIWVASGHHSAVNFGQYHFAGYFPNRPTIARTKMPVEDPSVDEWKDFLDKPEAALLECFPSQIQATKVMAVLDVLSYHSPDEEYIGGVIEASWEEDPVIKAAFERFSGRLKELEGVIDTRNGDEKLKNRFGAGVVPYELMKPFSELGVTGKGVPNSISI